MTRFVRPIVALAVAAVALAGCGNNGGNSGSTTPVTPVTKTEDMLGTCFGTRYRADPNTKATDPVPCSDLSPLSLTTKPVPI
ncbi:hypothetical protein KZX46_20015 [Polymorphobacter sp. PAMC 29334]|uniref:hypothetical protein n=1 Tax=Polymorphobacter sp. PAMC 29334 TaxID=2862331 RepID=UPI001C78C615|nr:hypothetical protein [Polymorphobacter sp. PAMC 29334]QYE34981.1 hypothetical protein KZX46_20015 [Polymorphobacter sp. PAMC 29334]